MDYARIAALYLVIAIATILYIVLLIPGAVFAHGTDGHPADPNLHTDAALKDCSVVFSSELSQSAFERFATEFGGVGAFKQGSPPTTLGQWGFAVDIEPIWFAVDEKSDAWNDAFAHPDAYHELGTDLAFPKLRLRVGILDNLDVGIFYTEQPNANYGWLGLEAKYGILKQSEDMPLSVAARDQRLRRTRHRLRVRAAPHRRPGGPLLAGGARRRIPVRPDPDLPGPGLGGVLSALAWPSDERARRPYTPPTRAPHRGRRRRPYALLRTGLA